VHCIITCALFGLIKIQLSDCLRIRVTDPFRSQKQIGQTAAFLCSPLASGITGTLVYVDNGLHAMGLAGDSQALARAKDE
jgi:enoyl-[acyl-carrier-protein] reductase (NADH)